MGDRCNADPKKAMMYAKKAIAAKADLTKKDFALANSVIGHCYYYGEGVEIDRKRSLKYIKIASEGGIAASQKLYGLGRRTKRPDYRSEMAPSRARGPASGHRHMSYFDSEEWGEAFKYAAMLEKKGIGKFGAFKPGFCYLWGYAEDGEDNDKAVECFKHAIEEQGSDWQQATYGLGRCYYSGWGVEADKPKTRENFEAVADEWLDVFIKQESLHSRIAFTVATDLGYMNLYGTAGFTVAMAEARRLFKVAIDASTPPKSPRESVLAHHGVAAYCTQMYKVAFKSLVGGCAEDFEFGPAYLCLAKGYYLGHGTEKDFGRVKEFALTQLERRMSCRNLSSVAPIGFSYLGKKVEQDKTQARKYFQKSADAGDPMGKAMLGIIYYYGTGSLDEDEDKATKLLADALSDTTNWNNTHDKLDASAHLGVLYNIEANYDEAFPLLIDAGTANFTITYAKIALCYCYGRGTKQDYKMAEKWAEKTVEEEKTSSVAKGDG
ncbi:hypothetical protein HK104_007085, partial [Borealophlyctis nickersoniae]